MISRISLSIGLSVASLCLRGTAHAADMPQNQVVCASGQITPKIALKPSVRAAQFTISSAEWQRSSSKPSGGLRFTRPSIPAPKSSAGQPAAAGPNTAPLLQPDGIAGQSTHFTATNRFENIRPASLNDAWPQEPPAEEGAAITIISDEVNDRQRAYAAAAMLKELIAHPEAEAARNFNEHLPDSGLATNASQGQPCEIHPSVQGSNGVIRVTMERMRMIAQRITGGTRPPLPPEERSWGRGPIGGVTW